MAETQQRQLTPTTGERAGALVLAAIAGGVFAVAWRDTIAVAAIGVALAAVLASGAVARNRAVMALGAFLTGFGPWGFAYILGAPYLALAAFLLWRAKRLDNSV
jgi:hypothetical protein